MALEQHAIPTEVTRYEFRLVGDMTLKQFGWLAGGIIIAILCYAMPIPFYFKWPLVVLFGFGGAAIAFVPYEGRTLDRWIVAFIRAIYSPTEFIWIKERAIPKYMEKNTIQQMPTVKKTMTAMEQAKLQEYIQSLPRMANVYQVDQQEAAALNQIDQLFGGMQPSTVVLPTEMPAENTPIILSETIEGEPPAPPVQIAPPVDLEALSQEIAEQTGIQQAQSQTQAQPTVQQQIIDGGPQGNQIQPDSDMQQAMSGATEQVGKTLEAIAPVTPPQLNPVMMPPVPTQPNIITGAIVDSTHQPIADTILEILSEEGFPVRALKTNKLGHFAIATPLKAGKYQMLPENPQYQFQPLMIEVKNNIIQPIQITAQ